MRISDWSSDVCSSDLSARVKIEGKRVVGSINLVGARFDDIVLPEYKETIDPGSPQIHLMSPTGGQEPYYAEFGWTVNGNGVALPNDQTRWTADQLGRASCRGSVCK